MKDDQSYVSLFPLMLKRSTWWRHPLFVLAAGTLFTVIAALIAVTFALITVSDERNDARDQVVCSRKYSTATAEAQARVLASIGSAEGVILTALTARSRGDEVTVQAQLELVPAISTELARGAAALDAAIDAQRASLTICT